MCGIFFLKGQEPVEHTDEYNDCISHRGPDNTQKLTIDSSTFVFHRLSINDTSDAGNQPIDVNGTVVVCNGEIYNWNSLVKKYHLQNKYKSGSDCEVIAHLYNEGLSIGEICRELDGVFAFVLLSPKGKVYAARDPLGVRPLYWCRTNKCIGFCSEAKGLMKTFPLKDIKPFEPGCYFEDESEVRSIGEALSSHAHDMSMICPYRSVDYPKVFDQKYDPDAIVQLLTSAVNKRLVCDRDVCCLLSGGLDSSLIASLASKIKGESSKERIHTFSIGIDKDAPDLIKARLVAEHINSIHTEIYYDPDEAIRMLPNIIYHLESYDCTTIRASTPMFILLKHISEKTNFKVVLSGEGADELFGGYLYLQNAPTKEDFQHETYKLLQNVHLFDVLRADRCSAAHGLEIRVPFFDKALVNAVLLTDPIYKVSSKERIEKWMLRDAFDGMDLLPESILWRKKDAFSDAVGRSWVKHLKLHSEKAVKVMYAETIESGIVSLSKEEYLYKILCKNMFQDFEQLPYMWRPRWTDVTDPSATLLSLGVAP